MSNRNRSGYCHVTPGRMRVRVTGVKGRIESAKSLQLLLACQPGVHSVKTSPVTGNVLVRFDEGMMSSEDVLASLCDLGHEPLKFTPRANTDDSFDAIADVGARMGARLAKAVLRQALGGSAAAIVLELI